MALPQLHFWDWTRPVLDHAVAELMLSWSGSQLDLADSVILVPTAESARRLREALAVVAAERGGAVMAPYIWPPEVALSGQMNSAALATRLQEQLVWTTVLEEMNIQEFPAVFPSVPTVEKRAWASGVAETLAALKQSTGGGGLLFADVAKALSESEDAARWADLAVLEERYLQTLGKLDVLDPQQVKRSHGRKPVLPEGIQRIMVFALADPPNLIRQWITNAAHVYPVKIFVHAPEAERQRFDDLGIPRTDAWTKNAPVKDLAEDHLHLVSQPEDQAMCAVSLLRGLAERGQAATIGLCEPGLAARIVGVLSGEGARAYDPAGRKAALHPLLELLRTWQQLAQSRTWRRLSAFLRQDDVLRAVCQPSGFTHSELLAWLDRFYELCLPATLDDALLLSRSGASDDPQSKAVEKLHGFLADVAARVDGWQNAEAPQALRGLLEWIHGAREFRTESEQDRGYVQLLGDAMQYVEEAHATAQKLGVSSCPVDLLPSVLRKLESIDLADPRGDVDLVLHGWLELHWEPAPGMVICGFNDESVPGTLTVDAFLPDHVRERLGLPCQAARCARDSYLLSAMAAQRGADKGLHLVLGRTSDAGDVLRPSRLLFACADDDLPSRVRHLFPKDSFAAAQQEPPRTLAWKLKPWRIEPGPASVSPSLLASYLRCPLRCYFEKFLSMSAVDAAQREMSPSDFGGIMHEVLATFGRDTAVRDCFAEQDVSAYLDDTLSKLAAARWGARPLLSTALQIETLRQRLAHAARVQAGLRAEGWRIVEVELDLNPGDVLTLAGLPLHARADRVDVNVHNGSIRVWDYKTRHKPKPPDEAHISTAKEDDLNDADLSWKCFADAKGKTRQWTDLQLPLYVWALRTRLPQTLREAIERMGVTLPEMVKVETGYFHLPAAVTETQAEPWVQLDESLIESAHACAEAAVERMKDGIFWPPNEGVRGDDYDELLMSDPLAAVEDGKHWKEADE